MHRLPHKSKVSISSPNECLLNAYSVEKLHFLRGQEIYGRLSDLISIRYGGHKEVLEYRYGSPGLLTHDKWIALPRRMALG